MAASMGLSAGKGKRSVSLDDRLAALHTVREAGAARIPDSVVAEADSLIARSSARRKLSGDYTVVGVFGATGSGKSSLVNALVGAEVARTHVRRPTTSEAMSVSWEPDGAVELLDWLEVRERNVHDTPLDKRASKLLLLDLPDFDSIDGGNRVVAERLAAQVDALMWVVDPQKYADDVLHAQFIAPHAKHSEVSLIVLNQIDLLARSDVPQVVSSLRAIVERDGVAKAHVLAVSARTGEGIPALRSAIGDLAATISTRDARLSADISTLAGSVPHPGTPAKIATKAVAAMRDEVALAAGVEVVAAAVAGSYRKRNGQATGWPLVSWIARLRADPLTRLGLGAPKAGRDPAVHRSSMPQLSSGAIARLSLSVRAFADAAAEGLSDSWRSSIRNTADGALAKLPDALDLAIARTPLPARGSWWWVVVAIVQWVAVLAGLAGVGWLLAAAWLPRIGFPPLEIPQVEGWAVPTLLIVGAILLGIVLGLLSGIIGSLVALARKKRTRKRLTEAVDATVRELVITPVDAELDSARALAAALAVAGA
jgi:GTPase SAR1 family protein